MPRAGDAFLVGQLPRSNDPLQRIDFQPPLLDITLQDLLDNAEQWLTEIGIPLLSELFGVDLMPFIPFAKIAFDSIELLFGPLNPLSEDFDPVVGIQAFIDLMVEVGATLPQVLMNVLFSGSGLTFLENLIPGLDASKIISGQFAQEMVDGLVEALEATAQAVIDAIVNLINGTSLTGQTLADLEAALQAFPANFVNGILNALNIPALDTSKITTGTFANSFVPGLVSLINALFGSGTIGATILAALVPGLDASKIITGLFGQSQVSGLTTDLAAKATTTTAALAVANNNFASDLSGWNASVTAAGPSAPTWDGTQGHTTLGSAKLIGNGTAYAVLGILDGAEWPALPGQTYTVSVWVKWASLTNGTDAALEVYARDGAHAAVSSVITTIGASGSGGWSNFTVNYTVPTGAVEFGIVFYSKNTGTIWLDEVAVTQTGVIAQAQTPSIEGEIRRTIENITSAVDNIFHPGSSSYDMQQSLSAQTATIAAQSAALAKLNAENEASNNSGVWDYDAFDYVGNLKDQSWYTSSFLAGSSAEGEIKADGINAGGVRTSNSAGNWEQMLTTNTGWFGTTGQTLTDYQKVSTPLASAINYFFDGFGDNREVRFYHYLRCNSAQTQWVRWQIRAHPSNGSGLKVRLQYKNGGSLINLGSEVSIGNIGSGVDINSYAGVLGADRTFQIKADNTLLHSVNDGSAVTAMGSSNRNAGWGEGYNADNLFLIQRLPPFIQHLVISDNAPAPVIGSMAQFTRVGTGQVSASTGSNLFPSSFFDTTSRVSADITGDLTNGKFTIGKTGTYTLKASVKVGSGFPNRVALRLYTDGSPARHSGQDSSRTIGGLGGTQMPRWVTGSWTFYTTAGTQIQLGYDSDGSSANTFTGESGGLETYFNIGVGNWSTK